MKSRSRASSRSHTIVAIMILVMLAIPTTSLISGSASAASWSTPHAIDATPGDRNTMCDLEKGQNFFYALSWLYDGGPVNLRRSVNETAWSAPVEVFGSTVTYAWPGMCVYSVEDRDHVLVSSVSPTNLTTAVAKSTDDGTTFTRLTDIPVALITTSIDTNASWFGGIPDSTVYVTGTVYNGVDSFNAVLVRSTDNGTTW